MATPLKNPRCDPDKQREAARAARAGAHAHRGHAQTAATKAKISAALKGRKKGEKGRTVAKRGQAGKPVSGVATRANPTRPGRCCTHTPKAPTARKRVG